MLYLSVGCLTASCFESYIYEHQSNQIHVLDPNLEAKLANPKVVTEIVIIITMRCPQFQNSLAAVLHARAVLRFQGTLQQVHILKGLILEKWGRTISSFLPHLNHGLSVLAWPTYSLAFGIFSR